MSNWTASSALQSSSLAIAYGLTSICQVCVKSIFPLHHITYIWVKSQGGTALIKLSKLWAYELFTLFHMEEVRTMSTAVAETRAGLWKFLNVFLQVVEFVNQRDRAFAKSVLKTHSLIEKPCNNYICNIYTTVQFGFIVLDAVVPPSYWFYYIEFYCYIVLTAAISLFYFKEKGLPKLVFPNEKNVNI